MKISRKYLRRLIKEQVEATLYEAEASPGALEDYAAGDMERGHPEEALDDELKAAEEIEPVPEEVAVEQPVDDRVTASMGSLRGWLSDTLTSVDDMGIQDNQIPSLVAAMDDLIASAQAGQLSGSEDRVRKGIVDASGVDRSEAE
jgi:hypothetical protein